MATLSTTAWVLHDLGLAAGFGGNLFGQLALHPAMKAIESKSQRRKVTHLAWDRYKFINAASLAAMAGAWLFGRTGLSGWEVSARARTLTLLKDGLVAGAFVTGTGAFITGTMLDAELKRDQKVESGHRPARSNPQRTAQLQRAVRVLGTVNIILQASVLAVTAMLAMQSGKSNRWALVARLLP
jgi:hypothetical protein